MTIHFHAIAMNAYRNYQIASGLAAKSMARLSSGFRINRAADDPAGLAISERMRAQIRGLNQAARNCQEGISMLQTAEGALQEAQSILQRMNELAVQAATGTNQEIDRQALAMEFNQLREELNDISRQTTYNDMPLLNGRLPDSDNNEIVLQVGARQGDTLQVNIPRMDATVLGLAGLDLSTQAGAQYAIGAVRDAVKTVSLQRAYLGAAQNRLEHKINYLTNAAENLSDAESRIRDTDIAAEMTSLVKNQIRMQAAMAMVAQANQMQQSLIRLLWMM